MWADYFLVRSLKKSIYQIQSIISEVSHRTNGDFVLHFLKLTASAGMAVLLRAFPDQREKSDSSLYFSIRDL
ncbi:hypothetical protein LEP1GSC188_2373 [Leptospira weilii serovar Topaz str. LT2116]|uniref:Uncharacterized protein n=1 Tax=Leptospira weilii serovar Topaz str. LT2116 TaxID=1088540 RepID=M3EL34_9LEPT|nr:hypothetical protein LEP1GSC188_2373 [Leptospira weilii serovar Topaz str. LT2116]